jgi:hypothetical protein
LSASSFSPQPDRNQGCQVTAALKNATLKYQNEGLASVLDENG